MSTHIQNEARILRGEREREKYHYITEEGDRRCTGF